MQRNNVKETEQKILIQMRDLKLREIIDIVHYLHIDESTHIRRCNHWLLPAKTISELAAGKKIVFWFKYVLQHKSLFTVLI